MRVSNALLLILLVLIVYVRATPDDLATSIDLTGIPAPFSFQDKCRLSSPEMWSVGGGGQIVHLTPDEDREFRPTKQDLNAVYFPVSTSGWVVGEEGTILHTEDTGQHWSEQNSNVKSSLKAITCIGENNCWIVGNSGTILLTDNKGEKWEKISIDSSASLYALHFIDAQVGWAVGEDGLILHTEDGGSTWTQQYLKMLLFPDSSFASPTNLRAVLFIDQKKGWVAGTDWIARTVDGGHTWITKNIDGSFIGLVTHDGIKIWAINDGVIALKETNYFSNDSGKSWKKWYPKKNN